MAADQLVVLDDTLKQGRIRSALSLSLVTGRSFQWASEGPGTGLDTAGVAFIRAAQTLGDAEVAGAEVGSPRLTFNPGAIRPGNYLFDVGAAGSVSLLLEMLAVPLSLVASESTLKLRGGTHLEGSPSFHYLSLAWAPMARQLGFAVRVELEHAGFGADIAGEVTARVFPFQPQPAFNRTARGNLQEAGVHSLLALGSPEVAQRQSERARRKLRESGIAANAENVPLAGRSQGSACVIDAAFEHSRVCYSALGTPSATPEEVADRAASLFLAFMSGRGAVDEFMADQLVVPLGVIAAGLAGPPQTGRFTTHHLTQRVVDEVEMIQRFLPIRAVTRGELGGEGEVIIAPPPAVG